VKERGMIILDAGPLEKILELNFEQHQNMPNPLRQALMHVLLPLLLNIRYY
jgi:hypothetical protein